MTVVHVLLDAGFHCTVYEVAPDVAVQPSVADVVLMEEVPRPVGTPQGVPEPHSVRHDAALIRLMMSAVG